MYIWFNYLLNKDIPSQEDGEGDTDHQQDVAPPLLRSRTHELLIIDADEKADREDGEETTIEHLSHQDHQ